MITRVIAKFLIKTLFRVEVEGTYSHNGSPKKRLIIANHSSLIDGFLLALFLPESPVFVVHKKSEENKFWRFFLSYVDYLTVDSTEPMAIRKVISLLDAGQTVAIFPEGKVTNSGTLMKIYSGAAFAAIKANATIIPIQISGVKHSYLSRLGTLINRRIFFPKLKLTILPETEIIIDKNLCSKDQREEATKEMHHIMMEMEVAGHDSTTIYRTLLSAMKTYGKNKLVCEDGITDDLTYHDLVKKSVALSVLLKKQNLSDRVGVLLPNSNVFVLAFYALQYMGKVPAMMNYTAGIRAIDAGLVASHVKTIITSRKFIDKAELHELVAQLSDYHIIYLEDLRKSITPKDKLLIVATRTTPSLTMVRKKPDDEAVVLFTSGSEGLPKGVVHSHSSLLMNMAQIKAIYDVSVNDKFMVCLPVFHVFGLTIGTLLPLSNGAAAYFYPNPLHYRVIPELVYNHACTVLLSTSTFLNGYARSAEPYYFHSLRYILAGAEKLSDEVVKIYHEKFGIRVMEGYGATETAPVIAANTVMAHQYETVGRLLPGIKAELVPVEGIEVGEHPIGRLIVRADNVMLGYLRADNPNVIEPSSLVDGKRVHDTGDIVEIDNKGYLRIKGRAKRFSKIAGEMVSLDSVEQMAAAASPECQHAVVYIEDARKGEALVLFTTDAALDRKRLQKSAKEAGMVELSVPRDIRVIEEVPVFASGKTNYPVLMRLVEKHDSK